MGVSNWKYVGECGVDSGTIWIGDPCYIEGEDRLKNWDEFLELFKEWGYDEPFQVNYKMGYPGLGVLLQGFGGDGVYPVYAKIKDGLLMEAKIIFNK